MVFYLIFGSLAMYEIESQVPDTNINSLLDAFWWASETLTTVGYGQTIPISETGRIFGIFYMWAGVAIAGTVITLTAKHFLIQRQIKTSTIHETKVEIIRNIANIASLNTNDIEKLKSLLDHLEKQLKKDKN